MHDFVNYVLYELGNSLFQVLCIGLIAAVVLFHIHRRYKAIHGSDSRFPWDRAAAILLFIGYLIIVNYATLGRGSGGHPEDANLHLFRAWRNAWNNFAPETWLNVLLNILLFVPMGAFLPLLFRRLQGFGAVLFTGLATSLYIELSQLLFGLGRFDVDDLLCNTLGTMVGYFALMTLQSLLDRRKRRKVLPYSLGVILPAAVIGGVFLLYHLQPYGNLPNAASYRGNTSQVEWVLQCQLPDSEDTVPLYRTEAFTVESCDRFGEQFEELIGAEFDDIIYYDNKTSFICRGSPSGAHFLDVIYMDRSFTYQWISDEEPIWGEAAQRKLTSLLKDFDITVPTEAEFRSEGDGLYIFEANRIATNSGIIDGTIQCRYAGNTGAIHELTCAMQTYDYVEDVQIITPEEALSLLMEGYFPDADAFLDQISERIHITSCRLDYTIDTKGFYQPIYCFEIAPNPDMIPTEVIIPALTISQQQ